MMLSCSSGCLDVSMTACIIVFVSVSVDVFESLFMSAHTVAAL